MNIQILCPAGHPVIAHSSKLGSTVFCPHCLTSFVAESGLDATRRAKPEKGKARPADDDDDDEEEEKPRKKGKAAAPKKKDDEEERPKLKRPTHKKQDEDEEDEDEDEEDDEEEEQDEEIPIEWTPRKRQLNVVRNGLMGYIVGFWAMVGGTLLGAVIVGLALMFQFGLPMLEFVPWVAIGMFAAIGIAYTALLVGFIMSFWGPKKAELMTSAILSIVFTALPALLLIINVSLTEGGYFNNATVRDNFATMIGGGCAISLFISLLFGLSLLGKLCLFMGDKKLSSQPITLGLGVIGFTVLVCALMGARDYLYKAFIESKNDIYNYLCYGLIAGCCACLFFLLRSLHGLVAVCQTLRRYIMKYMRDE